MAKCLYFFGQLARKCPANLLIQIEQAGPCQILVHRRIDLGKGLAKQIKYRDLLSFERPHNLRFASHFRQFGRQIDCLMEPPKSVNKT